MKKILSVFVLLSFLLTAAGCGEDAAKQMIDEIDVIRSADELYDLENVADSEQIVPTVRGQLCYDVVVDCDAGELETYFVLPENYENKKSPAILWLPDATVTDYRFMNVVEDGYVVVAVFSRGYPDSRSEGSSDFGGDVDLADLETLMDVIGHCEFIDRDRVFIVSNLFKSIAVFRYLADDTEGRVKGAAFARPLTDIFKFYNDIPEENKDPFARYSIGAFPDEEPEEYEKRCALNYIEKIDTPILVGVFEKYDQRYTIVDEAYYSEALIEKLEEYGKTFEVKRYDFASTDFYLPDSESGLLEWMNSLR